ncbi:D-2-hydroxyacid dehydrogenase [Aureitalea marina]|uniref:3-phosphoglycerate dehydrogenase n=1 Tax=Aureitalea marina TaxID=930804 RepID=A0A2S7KPB8_9FLAO|nr:D-2-hydroxyacid dehydrogenase [Aureitalea marina]PQB04476.1 3-phosphoglycerate dehydrogenase [Aureitalea marina]
MKILANDGISQSGVDALEHAGYEVITTKVAQEQLENYINDNQIDAILVRSATQVRQDLIDACPSLKLIGRGGVGMDNIDVAYAREKGLHVINTPAASSASVAELVFAHLFGGVRYLFDANRNMPLDGDTKFKDLKKNYAGGLELRGKTLGIVGFGRIGQEVAKIAIGCGMTVLAHDRFVDEAAIELDFFDGQSATFNIKTVELNELLNKSDFLSLHVPAQKDYVIGREQIAMMKDGAAIINAARGGVLDEVALVEALENKKLAFAALDTFENEPKPAIQVLMNQKVSLSPHIGAATKEAQDRIGTELAGQIKDLLG